MRWILTLPAFLLFFTILPAQDQDDSLQVRSIFDVVLEQGEAYENLRVLCKDIGHRLSGSPQAEMAVQWGYELMKTYEPDRVYLQEITVPHWERGTNEIAWFKDQNGQVQKLSILALGGSIPTDGLIRGEVVEVRSFEEMEEKKEEIKDKIVFFNRAYDPKFINTFQAYGACVSQRWNGANVGGKHGAKAVLIRSLTHIDDDHPHTGSMGYEEGERKIPGAALSSQASNTLEKALEAGSVEVFLQMDCRSLGEKTSHNVIAEIKGSENPENIMVVGGHLDSWDVGEGAHDDGAGIVQSIELLHVFKTLGIKPKNTLRVVLFMNEENGNNGGKTYASLTKDDRHILAIESDRGGFTPRGFSIDGTEEQIEFVRGFEELLDPYYLHHFEKGYGGVDINPIKEYGDDVVLMGLFPDSQRYFDYHHSASDVFEAVNKRELELGAGAMAAMIYLMDKYYEPSVVKIRK